MAKNFKNILLIGLGGVGYYLAKRFTHDGHAITIIESDPELIRRADGEVDARFIQGDAMCFSCWQEAASRQLDYLIAVTDNDAVNIMSSLIADRLGIQEKIARVRSLELWNQNAILNCKDLKIDLVIRPEELVAQDIAQLLEIRAGNDIIDVAEGHVQVMATHIGQGSTLAHTLVKDISKKYEKIIFRIVAIARGINTIIPGGEDEILPGDHIFILVRNEDLASLMQLTGYTQRRRHRVMIIGGGFVGSRVAQLLEESFPVRVIEKDERRAEVLSHNLKSAVILHGEGSDTDTLIMGGLLKMDTIITATGDNETNIMTSVLAKHLIMNQPGELHGKVAKTIVLVQREDYLALAASMGSDIVLDKKVLAGNEILKYIRRGKLLSVAHLHGVDAEVVELIADKRAPITRKPLFKLSKHLEKIIIGGVKREGNWQIAVGSTQIQPGEKVIGVCASRHLKDLQHLFDA